MNDNEQTGLMRWRLILGKFAENQIDNSHLSKLETRMDDALDFIYSREYSSRGVREHSGSKEKGLGGGLGGSQLTVPKWIREIRKLFPRETIEIMEKHALQKYGMTDLVNNADTLKNLEPNQDLLKSILTFKGTMKKDVLLEAKKVIRKVVEEIKQKLEQQIKNAIMGNLNKFAHSPLKVARNIDWPATIRKNMKNYNSERKQMVLEDVRFFSRVTRRIPWDIILCVDQSGSMLDSVIHSAVLASILHSLPMINVKLVIFDTAIVDLSDYVDDPVEILMSVQLGGGTDIGKALRYCEKLIVNPKRTVMILLSDFEEGASPNVLLSTVHRINEAGAKLLGLASLDAEAEVYYDKKMAQRLLEHGMEIAALTPKHLAEWLGKVIT